MTGLDVVAGLSEAADRSRRELKLQLTLAGALLAAKGWAAPETGRAYARARELCLELGETIQLPTALTGLRNFHINCARVNLAQEFADELLQLGRRQHDTEIKMHGHLGVGINLLMHGDFEDARIHLDQTMALYDPLRHRLPLGVNDPRVGCRTFIGWSLQYQGYLDRAVAQFEEAFARAQGLALPYTLAFAMHVSCVAYQVRRDRAKVAERSAALRALAAEQGFAHFLATGTFFHGWAQAGSGDLESGIEEMQRGIVAKQATGAQLKVPYYLSLLAMAHARVGEPARAAPLVGEALERIEKTGERWFEAEAYRIKGEVVLRFADPDQAEADRCFRRAIEVARNQGAKLWELRAASSLARLWTKQGKRAQARDLLAPVYAWFTEGFDTADLKDARALLDELA
jgi:predicted ATPase